MSRTAQRLSTPETLSDWALRTNARFDGKDWVAGNLRACIAPARRGYERSVVSGCTAIHEGILAQTDDDGGYMHDYVLTPGLLYMVEGVRTLLDGDCGRLDCGTVSSWLDTVEAFLLTEEKS